MTPLDKHNKVLRAAEQRARDLEPVLVAAIVPVLVQAGREAAARFEQYATDHLTAAAWQVNLELGSQLITAKQYRTLMGYDESPPAALPMPCPAELRRANERLIGLGILEESDNFVDDVLAKLGRDTVQALVSAGSHDYCLPSELRSKTEPVTRAMVENVARSTMEGVGLKFDVTNPFIDKALEKTGSMITNIAETTQADVMKVIGDSYAAGMSIPQTAQAIRDVMESTSVERATLIARTEMVGAINGASLASTQAASTLTGDKYVKTWMTAPGARFPRHEITEGLDGQTVPLDAYFDVNGSQLQYPGDPDGDAGEVCNCRCAMSYGGALVDESDLNASARPIELGCVCLASGASWRSPETVIAAAQQLLAAADGPGWTAPAPEEILSTTCEPPKHTPGISSRVRSHLPAPLQPKPEVSHRVGVRPHGDTVSARQAPFLPPEMVARVNQLGLDAPLDALRPTTAEGNRIFPPDKLTTEALYKHNGVWDAEHKAQHDRAVLAHFIGKTPPLPGQRKFYMTAGGGASGKSALRFDVNGKDLTMRELAARPDTIYINPDTILETIKEYNKLVDANDWYAASGAHEESSEIAKAVAVEAQKRGFSVVMDTTGSGPNFISNIKTAAAAGYKVEVSMVSVPTNEAIIRSMLRGDAKTGPDAGRYVALQALKDAHAGASRQMDIWRSMKEVSKWRLYDNSLTGPHAELRLVARGGKGKSKIIDEIKFQEILAKQAEAYWPGEEPFIQDVEQVAHIIEQGIDTSAWLDEWVQGLTEGERELIERVFDVHDIASYGKPQPPTGAQLDNNLAGAAILDAVARQSAIIPQAVSSTVTNVSRSAAAGQIGLLDHALTSAAAPANLVAYRGIPDITSVLSASGAIDPHQLVGRTFHDTGYMAAALSPADTKLMMESSSIAMRQPAILELRITKGQQVAPFGSGKQVVMPRSTSFKILDVFKVGRVWRVIASVLDRIP